MTRTFLVALNLEQEFSPADIAADLQEDLLAAGYDVESVKPWDSHTPGVDSYAALTLPTPPSAEEPPPTLTGP